jgi:molybdenum-dependent DNA-binding transcriptional regulator ModE
MSHATYDELRRVIHAVRRRWRLKIALRGAAAVVGAGLVAFAASAYAMDHFRYEPWAVTSFRLFAYVALLALGARFLAVPLWGRVSEERVALYVEEHEPSLQAAVLSAVEVGPKVADRPDVSPALVQRLIESAIEKCQTIDYGRHVERQGLRRASGLLAAVAAAGMVATILSPAFLRHAAPFFLAPWSVRAASPYSIEVDPGNATVPRGGNQAVTARLQGFEAEKAELAVRSGAAGDWKRWPMTADGGTGAFQFVLFALDAASDYYVEASGVRSSAFHLDVADIPYVKRVDLEYHFPAYTGLSPQAVPDTGDVAALQGTEVRVRVTPTMKVSAGRLTVDGQAPRAMSIDDGALTAAFDVQKEGFYRIELAGREGRLQSGSPDYTIDVLKDQPPSVRFTRPGRDTKVTSIEEVFTELKAEDDFGVARAELVYSVNGGPEKTLVVHQGRARKSVSGGHTFFLEELSLEPGDFISYFARAADESPSRQTATTDIYFLEVRPFGKEYRQADERGAPGGAGGADAALSFQQRQIIAATFKLVRDRARVPGTQYGQDLATLALMQGRLHDQVQSLVRRMATRGVAEPGSGFAKTADSLRLATVEMVSAKGHLEAKKAREALTPEQAALKHLQRAEAAFREVQVSFGNGGGQGGSAAANAEELANLFELELDKLKNQYETVQRGQQQQTSNQVDEALERLRQLAQRQEQENERQRQLAGRPPNMSGGRGGWNGWPARSRTRRFRTRRGVSRTRPTPCAVRARAARAARAAMPPPRWSGCGRRAGGWRASRRAASIAACRTRCARRRSWPRPSGRSRPTSTRSWARRAPARGAGAWTA